MKAGDDRRLPASDLPGEGADSRLRVLVADDDEATGEVVRALLAALGCEPRLVSEGRAAVEAAGAEDWDLIFLDYNMPGLEGPDCARRIRELQSRRPGGRRTPLIMLSADLSRKKRARCVEAGIDDFLEKPCGAAELAAVIRKWTGPKAPAGATGPGTAPAASPPAEAPPPASPLDREILSELRGLQSGDPGLLRRLVKVFLDQTPPLVETIRRAGAEGDAEALERAAHTLKSASGHLGALRLSRLCRELEEAARRREEGRFGSLAEAVTREFSRAAEALRDEAGR